MPTCRIIAGPNDTGKTTSALEYRRKIALCRHFINTDLVAADLRPLTSGQQCLAVSRLCPYEIEHCSNVSLHRGNVSLHRGNVNLHRGNVSLHCGNVNLHRSNVNLHRSNVNWYRGNVSLRRGNAGSHYGTINFYRGKVNFLGHSQRTQRSSNPKRNISE
jgi:hypothetical protein